MNLHGVNDVGWTEIQTAKPLVSEPIAFEVEKSRDIDQIPAELIKEGGRAIRYQIHKLIISIWN